MLLCSKGEKQQIQELKSKGGFTRFRYLEKGIRAFKYWRNGLFKKTEMTSSKIKEGSKCKLSNRALIIYHSRMKTETCEY